MPVSFETWENLCSSGNSNETAMKHHLLNNSTWRERQTGPQQQISKDCNSSAGWPRRFLCTGQLLHTSAICNMQYVCHTCVLDSYYTRVQYVICNMYATLAREYQNFSQVEHTHFVCMCGYIMHFQVPEGRDRALKRSCFLSIIWFFAHAQKYVNTEGACSVPNKLSRANCSPKSTVPDFSSCFVRIDSGFLSHNCNKSLKSSSVHLLCRDFLLARYDIAAHVKLACTSCPALENFLGNRVCFSATWLDSASA